MSLIILFYFLTMFSALTMSWQENPLKMAGVRPGYNFQYFIRNDETGDFKSQQEVREGDTVRGSYSVAEPNGDLRVVTYHADQNSGFNAKVQVQPRSVPIPFPPIKSFHPMVSPPNPNYHPLDIKVLPSPTTTTEPSKKTVEIYIEDEIAPEISTTERASVASTTSAQPPPVQSPCSPVDISDNRHRPLLPHHRVVPTLSNVPMNPLYIHPFSFDYPKHPPQPIPTLYKSNVQTKPQALNPAWAFILVPVQEFKDNTYHG